VTPGGRARLSAYVLAADVSEQLAKPDVFFLSKYDLLCVKHTAMLQTPTAVSPLQQNVILLMLNILYKPITAILAKYTDNLSFDNTYTNTYINIFIYLFIYLTAIG